MEQQTWWYQVKRRTITEKSRSLHRLHLSAETSSSISDEKIECLMKVTIRCRVFPVPWHFITMQNVGSIVNPKTILTSKCRFVQSIETITMDIWLTLSIFFFLLTQCVKRNEWKLSIIDIIMQQRSQSAKCASTFFKLFDGTKTINTVNTIFASVIDNRCHGFILPICEYLTPFRQSILSWGFDGNCNENNSFTSKKSHATCKTQST